MEYDVSAERLVAYVLDEDFMKVGLVQKYYSFIWTDRFLECGDFEIVVPYSKENTELYKKDYYISCNRSDKVMIIEAIKVSVSPENGDQMMITGRSLESILDRRVIINDVTYDEHFVPKYVLSNESQILNVLNEIVIDNCALYSRNNSNIMCSTNRYSINSPINQAQKRALPMDFLGYIYGNSTSYLPDHLKTGIAVYNGIGATVLDAIQDICADCKLGFMILCNFDEKRFKMLIYDGDDKSNEVFFSIEKKNIVNYDTSSSSEDFKNYVYVKGDEVPVADASTAANDLSNVNVGAQNSGNIISVDSQGQLVYSNSLDLFNAGVANAGKYLMVGPNGRISYKEIDDYDGEILIY